MTVLLPGTSARETNSTPLSFPASPYFLLLPNASLQRFLPGLFGLLLLAQAAPGQTIVVSRAELKNGNELRLEGSNAQSNATILVDGIPRGQADGEGSFRFEFSPYQSDDSLSLAGPRTVERGDRVTFTATLTNTGAAALVGLQISLTDTPGIALKNVTPGGLASLANLQPGASFQQAFDGRADREAVATITVEVFSAGVSIGVVKQTLIIIK